ncbi:YopX family protein [Staphylococcus borealis]|uniref:YopX family protein n=1 Tax=Staphylococcus borealis TaxID=2742203 RepID=UPI0039E98AB8
MIPKFRVWDKEEKIMIDWIDLDMSKDGGEDDFIVFEPTGPVKSAITNPILMQATGVTSIYDDNSTEIYEGDIVKTKSSPNGRFIGYVGNAVSRFEVRGVKQYKGLKYDLDGSYIVIGNVHQNPELLEDE